MDRKLTFPPRRLAAIALLATLPMASFFGAFDRDGQQRSETGGVALALRYPVRALYREGFDMELTLTSERGCARLTVTGLQQYLSGLERVIVTPPPPDARVLYDGALAARTPLSLRVQGEPVQVGRSEADLMIECDGRPGPQAHLETLTFP